MTEAARKGSTSVGSVQAVQIEVVNYMDIVAARRAGREMAVQCGFKPVDCAQIATAISELARNIYLYAKQGRISIAPVEDQHRSGLEIVAEDHGPGIVDVELAMRDGYTTSRGLGLGLPGTKRLMDDFELTTTVRVGTTVRTRKWLGS